jgi:CO/xanthine dehydrogenase Mo-binding subunit
MSEITHEPGLLVEGPRPERLDRALHVVGTPVNRLDGVEKVTGRAKYSSDMSLPGMLYARIARCPHAHARIKRIDASKAESLPGVHAILTAENTRDWRTYWYMVPQPAFAEEIGCAGQEVAVVAAADVETAMRAVELLDIEYEVLPAVFSPEEASRPDAPLVPILDVEQERAGNAQSPPFVFERGDLARGFEDAEVVVEDTYRLPSQFHVDIQTRCCIADWDGDRLTVYDSSQGVWNVKLQLARSLGLPPEKVRVIVKYMGGGFGSKAGAQRYAHYAAKLAMLTGKPVKLELTRREEFLSHPRRYAATVGVKLGARRDGALTAIAFRVDLDLGVGTLYRSRSHREMILNHVSEMYRCANVRAEIRGVYTNTPPTGPTRGVLNPVATFTIEASMDHLAESLGTDPVTLRMRNYAQYADEERKVPYSSKHLDRCIEAVTGAIGWERRGELAELNKQRTKKRGLGMACYIIDRSGLPPFDARAEVLIGREGTVELRAGVVEIGAGQITVLPMIAAEELGVEAEAIRVVWGDTESTLYAPSSHASRITVEMGPAVLQAAALARQELFRRVAPALGVPEAELRSSAGRIYARGEPRRSVSFVEACALIPPEGVRTVGKRAPNPEEPVLRTFGAQAAEVEVDVESGELEVLRVVSAHDIGRALNPKLVESQQYGGVIMGLGYGLYEEPEIDRKTGALLNADVHQYRLPTALETPEIQVINVEGEDPYYPYSAKPVGEAPLLAVIPAVRNAVFHASRVAINELPISVARVLESVEGARHAG